MPVYTSISAVIQYGARWQCLGCGALLRFLFCVESHDHSFEDIADFAVANWAPLSFGPDFLSTFIATAYVSYPAMNEHTRLRLSYIQITHNSLTSSRIPFKPLAITFLVIAVSSIVIAGSLIVFASGRTFSFSFSDPLDSTDEDLRFLVFLLTVWFLHSEEPGGSSGSRGPWGPFNSWLWGNSTPESCDCGWDPEILPLWLRFCLRLGLGGKKFLRTWNKGRSWMKTCF